MNLRWLLISRYLLKGTIIAIVLALLFLLGRLAYERWFAEGAVPDRAIYTVRGIDVSHHNGDIDFARVGESDADVGFVYIKATEGADYVDPDYVRNFSKVRRCGIPAGAYHFFRYDTDGELQALNFLHALRGRNFTLPPAIDVEDWGNPDGNASAKIVERLRIMTDILRAEGYSPMIYTNVGGYHRLIRGNFDYMPLWISSFSYPPLDIDPDNTRWAIWQFSHRGDVPGINNPTDLNVINPSHPLWDTLALPAVKDRHHQF